MKTFLGWVVLAVLCFGLAAGVAFLATRSPGASAHQDFFRAVATNDPAQLMGLMHPELRKVIDPPILRAWQKEFNRRLGSFKSLKRDGFSTATRRRGVMDVYEVRGEVELEKGIARADLDYVDGKIVQFTVTSPQMPEAWFTGPDGTEYYQAQGKLLLERLVGREPDLAWQMLHEDLQRQVGRVEFNRQAGALLDTLGPLKAVTFESERFEEVDGFQNLRLFFTIEAEKASTRGMVKFQFVGLQAHILGYHVE